MGLPLTGIFLAACHFLGRKISNEKCAGKEGARVWGSKKKYGKNCRRNLAIFFLK